MESNAIYLSSLLTIVTSRLNPSVVRFCRASLREFHLVHFFGLYDTFGPVVSGFCRRYQIPYVVEPMGMYRPIDRGFKLKRLWHRNLGDSYLKRAAYLVATSEMEQQELVEDGVPAEKVVIRYNGVDRDAPATQPPPGSFRAQYGISARRAADSFLSRLIPRKGADILIDAFAQVCPSSGCLVIAGPEGDPAYVAGFEKARRGPGRSIARALHRAALRRSQSRRAAGRDGVCAPVALREFCKRRRRSDGPRRARDHQRCMRHSLAGGRAAQASSSRRRLTPLDRGAARTSFESRALRAISGGLPGVIAELRWDQLRR